MHFAQRDKRRVSGSAATPASPATCFHVHRQTSGASPLEKPAIKAAVFVSEATALTQAVAMLVKSVFETLIGLSSPVFVPKRAICWTPLRAVKVVAVIFGLVIPRKQPVMSLVRYPSTQSATTEPVLAYPVRSVSTNPPKAIQTERCARNCVILTKYVVNRALLPTQAVHVSV